jgi:hypothetical protein
MRKLMKALKTEISGDLHDLAKMLQSKGRGKDTILAHITPKEAELLKKRGGSGTRNPDTGLLEYENTPSVGTDLPEVTTTVASDVTSPSTVSDNFYIPQLTSEQQSAANAPAGTEVTSYGDPIRTAGADATQFEAPSVPVGPNLSAAKPDLSYQNAIDEQELEKAGISTSAPSKGFFGKMTGDQLARLGLAGAGAIFGGVQARKAQKEKSAAEAQQRAIAKPYQERGNALIGQAEKGILSPESQQAYQAAQAQLTQNAQNRGGVGVAQAANQLAMIRSNLLQTQYNYGLKIAQIGDNISLGAIQTGLQMDKELNASTQDFYTNLAAISAGGFGGQRTIPGA